jgi:signal transduction histidine kinase
LLVVLGVGSFVQWRQLAVLNAAVVHGEDDIVLFSVGQLEVEYLRFREELHAALLMPDPIDLPALQMRYGILVSRIDLLHGDSPARVLKGLPAREDAMRRLQAFIEHADPYLGDSALQPANRQALKALFGEVEALAEPVHLFIIKLMHRFGEQITQRNVTVQQHNQVALALTAFLMVLTLTFAVLALRQMQRLDQLAERLEESRGAAEAASLAKSTFLASMSHELRTPLNAVIGFADLLKRERGLSERQVRSLDLIEQGGHHLLALINDVLDLARIEAGRFDLYPEAEDLPGFLRVVTDVMRVRAEQKNLLFQLDVPPDLPSTVYIDEQRLRQVLLNLLGNAVKFTDAGGVSLRVRSSAAGEDRVRLSFEVRDTGIGIDAAQLPRLFLPFEQVSEARRRSAGTGLGLAISRQLVRSMGGDIEVDTTLGQGSTFRFEIEVALGEGELQAEQHERLVIGYQGPRRQVLVVDDVPENRLLVVEFLTSLGFELAEAGDGREGMEKAHKLHPDLILIDNVMPVMSGLEATRLLREEPDFADVPIIALSASATRADRERSLGAGVNAFLNKPLDFDELLQQMGPLMRIDWVYEGA